MCVGSDEPLEFKCSKMKRKWLQYLIAFPVWYRKDVAIQYTIGKNTVEIILAWIQIWSLPLPAVRPCASCLPVTPLFIQKIVWRINEIMYVKSVTECPAQKCFFIFLYSVNFPLSHLCIYSQRWFLKITF